MGDSFAEEKRALFSAVEVQRTFTFGSAEAGQNDGPGPSSTDTGSSSRLPATAGAHTCFQHWSPPSKFDPDTSVMENNRIRIFLAREDSPHTCHKVSGDWLDQSAAFPHALRIPQSGHWRSHPPQLNVGRTWRRLHSPLCTQLPIHPTVGEGLPPPFSSSS